MLSQAGQPDGERLVQMSGRLNARQDHLVRPARSAGPQRTRRTRRLAPELLWLEDRPLLSTFDVISTADDGSTGTLRWAVAQANRASTSSTIDSELSTTPAPITPPIIATITLTPGAFEPITYIIANIPDISLSASTRSAVYSQSITFVATVSAASGTPTGTVTFSDGGTTLGTVNLNAADQATLTTSALTIGSHSITASYSGDADDEGVTTTPVVESVSQAATQVVLVPQPGFKKNKLVSLTLKAEVQPIAPGGGVPSGTLTFEVKTKSKKTPEKVLGTAALNSNGTATLTLKPDRVLNEPITLVYGGDVDFASSTSSPRTLTQKGLKSLARPMLSLQVRGHRRV
jgi:large repetitive protein